jgi:hypothetical protein
LVRARKVAAVSMREWRVERTSPVTVRVRTTKAMARMATEIITSISEKPD